MRELRNVREYAFAIGEGPVLAPGDLPPELSSPQTNFEEPRPHANTPPPLPSTAASPEAAKILRAIERASGSKARAAKSLGISRITLWRRIKELGLVEPRDEK